jgi:hypothetical protein
VASIEIDVVFRGKVTVGVPDYLPATARHVLGRKLVVAQMLATAENSDCGEALETACDEFAEETNGDEADFDRAKITAVAGSWESLQDSD